jgi:hypothetical protein
MTGRELIRVLVVSPFELVREGVHAVLDRTASPRRTVRHRPEDDGEPDVVVVDLVGLRQRDGADLDHWVWDTDAVVVGLTRDERPDLDAVATVRGAVAVVSLSADVKGIRHAVVVAGDERRRVIAGSAAGRWVPPYRRRENQMAVTSFQDLPLADRDREWDGDAAEKRVRRWAGADEGPNEKYRDAHVWYDADKKDNFTAYKLLIADVVDDRLVAVPRGVMAAGNVMVGGRGGVDLPSKDRDRVKSHLAKYYAKMDDTAPWED